MNKMEKLNEQCVVYVSTEKLQKNELLDSMYLEPENYDVIKSNINAFGLLTPLLVDEDYFIISGNLRLQIAIDLQMKKVPVVIIKAPTDKREILSISTNQFRKKSCVEILREINFFEKFYSIKPGQRTDLNPELKLVKQEKDSAYNEIGVYKVNKLKSIQSLGDELYGNETKKVDELLMKVDKGNLSLNKVAEILKDLVQKEANKNNVPDFYEIITEKVKIYNHTCENMYELNNESVQTIITSPPYFNMRDYGTGKSQLGLEKKVEEFIKNLVNTFDDAKRVLKNEGSLFVNINDCVIDKVYQCVPELFLFEMKKKGWLYVDQYLWLKPNSQFIHGKRSVRNFEPIFHFVKSSDYYFDDSWLRGVIDENDIISYGTTKKFPKLLSSIDLRDGILKHKISNTFELRKKCNKEKNILMQHSATFPLALPMIFVLSTSKPYDIILDMFSGTSTTGEISVLTNRKYVGYELNPQFVMASEVRLSEYELGQVA